MEFWIEGSIDEVAATTASGLAQAVATNPSIMRRWTTDGRSLEAVVREACSKLDVPLYVQLHGPDVDTYQREMEALLKISDQIHPKLVASPAGLEAAGLLEKQMDRRTLVTTIATVNQAFLAAVAGTSYIAPYYGRIDSAGVDAVALIRDIADVYARHGVKTQIAAASLRRPEQLEAALLAGAHVLVAGYGVLQHLLDSPLTQNWIDRFEDDWASYTYEFEAAD